MSNSVKAVYLIKSDKIEEASQALVVGQSIGNPYLRSKYETPELLAKYSARVTEITLQSPGVYRVSTEFPLALFTLGSFTHLLTVLMGGQMDIDIIRGCRLIEVDFPPQLVRSFPGPKFGVSGIRDKIRVYNRPLIGGIVKPKTGVTLDMLCEMVKLMAEGGVDFIKEDEILGEIDGAPLMQRIEAVARVLEGSSVIYAPAINVPLAHFQEVAATLNAHENVYGYHLNVWAGFDVFSYLSQLATQKISFYQKSGDGVMTRGDYSIAFDVWCLLIRLAGADMTHVGMMGGYLDETHAELKKRLDALQGPCGELKSVIPSFSCGATPKHVPLLQEAFGNDIMITAGGAIHSHPKGTLAGVRAFREMADAVMTRSSVLEPCTV